MTGSPPVSASPGPELLDTAVQHYPWGSQEAIPALLGVEPDGRPWAELWIGAHPQAPSRLAGGGPTLDELVAADPGGWLGPAAAERFGRFPFLLKVLAAGAPLSLQVHPSAAQAAAGFAREEAAAATGGPDRTGPSRNYRDDWPKPEVVCALTDFEALSGFRPLAESAPVLRALAGAVDGGDPGGLLFDDIVASLLDPPGDDAADPDDAGRLRALVHSVLALTPDDGAVLARSVRAAAGVVASTPGHPPQVMADLALLDRVAATHPVDPGLVIVLLLNQVRLAPGEALFTPAGVLHTYLSGLGVELMASSDNVLRGGLTPKHVDVDELAAVLDPMPAPPRRITPKQVSPVETAYPVPVPQFRLSRLDLAAGEPVELAPVDGPQLLLGTSGSVRVSAGGIAVELTAGIAASLAHRSGPVTLTAAAPATVFRARVA